MDHGKATALRTLAILLIGRTLLGAVSGALLFATIGARSPLAGGIIIAVAVLSFLLAVTQFGLLSSLFSLPEDRIGKGALGAAMAALIAALLVDLGTAVAALQLAEEVSGGFPSYSKVKLLQALLLWGGRLGALIGFAATAFTLLALRVTARGLELERVDRGISVTLTFGGISVALGFGIGLAVEELNRSMLIPLLLGALVVLALALTFFVRVVLTLFALARGFQGEAPPPTGRVPVQVALGALVCALLTSAAMWIYRLSLGPAPAPDASADAALEYYRALGVASSITQWIYLITAAVFLAALLPVLLSKRERTASSIFYGLLVVSLAVSVARVLVYQLQPDWLVDAIAYSRVAFAVEAALGYARLAVIALLFRDAFSPGLRALAFLAVVLSLLKTVVLQLGYFFLSDSELATQLLFGVDVLWSYSIAIFEIALLVAALRRPERP